MTLKDINWNQVYYFFEVARKLSMKDAAHSTGVSLPTVSEQIKRLETSLNVLLFKRFPRRIELTSEGESLFQYSKEMFDSGMRFVDAVSNSNNVYSARVGIQESVAERLQMQFLETYLDKFMTHGIIHTIKENNSDKLIERLTKGEFDWAISFEPSQSFRLNSAPIGKTEVGFVCAKNLPITAENQSDLLRMMPFARTSWDFKLNELVENRLAQENIVPMEILEIDHIELRQSMVAKGKCITTILKSDLPRYPHLKYFSLNEPIELTSHAVWRKSNERMTAVKVLTAMLGAQEGESEVDMPVRTPEARDLGSDQMMANRG